jgi:hypothetical protein
VQQNTQLRVDCGPLGFGDVSAEPVSGPRAPSPYAGALDTAQNEVVRESLANLRTIVPVFARELTKAHRQAASLRSENARLITQIRELRGLQRRAEARRRRELDSASEYAGEQMQAHG